MVSQVAGDGIGGGRQQAFPLYFKMAYGRSVAAARVVALGSFNILGETGHVTVVKACFLSGLKAGMLGTTVSGAGDCQREYTIWGQSGMSASSVHRDPFSAVGFSALTSDWTTSAIAPPTMAMSAMLNAGQCQP